MNFKEYFYISDLPKKLQVDESFKDIHGNTIIIQEFFIKYFNTDNPIVSVKFQKNKDRIFTYSLTEFYSQISNFKDVLNLKCDNIRTNKNIVETVKINTNIFGLVVKKIWLDGIGTSNTRLKFLNQYNEQLSLQALTTVAYGG